MSVNGITMTDSVMNMKKGWIVVYKDNSVVTEDELEWRQVKKGEIKILALKWNTKYWSIRDKTAYVQFKRGMAMFSASGPIDDSVTCVDRCIGYYENGEKIIYRVNDLTGKMKMEVQ
jgi:hypothetical protein